MNSNEFGPAKPVRGPTPVGAPGINSKQLPEEAERPMFEPLDFLQREQCRHVLQFGSAWREVKKRAHAIEWAESMDRVAAGIRSKTSINPRVSEDLEGLSAEARRFVANEFEGRAKAIRNAHGISPKTSSPDVQIHPTPDWTALLAPIKSPSNLN
jgi:hypothetical protein